MKKVNIYSKNIPEVCGVYAFLNKKGEFLYIGKAKNIKKRIKNHLSKKPVFVLKADKLGFIQTDSEFEALILESQLIKKHKPKYNVIWRDDKAYFYLNKTKDKYPRIVINHEKGLGPFTKGKELKRALEALRYVFPFYSNKKHPEKKCSLCHLGVCPGPNISLKEYRKNIQAIFAIFSGKKQKVLKEFYKQMKEYSCKQEYEKAALKREEIKAIEKIIAEANIIKSNVFQRAEAYDVSNIQGKQATGSMVVFVKGKSCKNLYRKFKIHLDTPNDTAMIKEMISRRIKHQEWPLPDFILIDGGKGQLSAAQKALQGYNIKIAALAKKKNELFFPDKKVLLSELPENLANLILQMRDEAHRFALAYHKKLREKV